jgi:hypothetical protein
MFTSRSRQVLAVVALPVDVDYRELALKKRRETQLTSFFFFFLFVFSTM